MAVRATLSLSLLLVLVAGCIQPQGTEADGATAPPPACESDGCEGSTTDAPPASPAKLDRGAEIQDVALAAKARNEDETPENEVVVQVTGKKRTVGKEYEAIAFAGSLRLFVTGTDHQEVIERHLAPEDFLNDRYWGDVWKITLPGAPFKDGASYTIDGAVVLDATGERWPLHTSFVYAADSSA